MKDLTTNLDRSIYFEGATDSPVEIDINELLNRIF